MKPLALILVAMLLTGCVADISGGDPRAMIAMAEAQLQATDIASSIARQSASSTQSERDAQAQSTSSALMAQVQATQAAISAQATGAAGAIQAGQTAVAATATTNAVNIQSTADSQQAQATGTAQAVAMNDIVRDADRAAMGQAISGALWELGKLAAFVISVGLAIKIAAELARARVVAIDRESLWRFAAIKHGNILVDVLCPAGPQVFFAGEQRQLPDYSHYQQSDISSVRSAPEPKPQAENPNAEIMRFLDCAVNAQDAGDQATQIPSWYRMMNHSEWKSNDGHQRMLATFEEDGLTIGRDILEGKTIADLIDFYNNPLPHP